jgi:hypothetical protein
MDVIRAHTRPIPPLRHRIDGTRWVSIRPIERADAADLSDFYARLSPESGRRDRHGTDEGCLQHAGRVGLGRLNAMLFAENLAMRRLLRDAGCAIHSDSVEFGVEKIALDVAT